MHFALNDLENGYFQDISVDVEEIFPKTIIKRIYHKIIRQEIKTVKSFRGNEIVFNSPNVVNAIIFTYR